jgi:hypothetical protein
MSLSIKFLIKPILFSVLLVSEGQALRAATISHSLGSLTGATTDIGSLKSQADVLEEAFDLTSVSNFKAFTVSYGGGENLDHTSFGAGGFEPELVLYTGLGKFIAGQDISSPIAAADPSTGLALDADLSVNALPAGSYILVLTDWLNQQAPSAQNLADGFSDLGSGGSTFVDAQLNQRNGNFAVNLSATPAAITAAPEPSSLSIMGLLLIAVSLVVKRTCKFGSVTK